MPSNGKVRLTLEEAGTYTVTASKEGYLTASSKITVSFPSANTPASSTTKLISPSNSVLMDNGRTDWRDNIVWDFDWSDVKGATQYQLYVIGDNVPNPMINTITSDSSYHYISQSYCSSNIGWTWKVRAKVNDQWSGWSETRSFQVEKVDTDQPIQTVTQPTPAPTSARTPATTRHTTPVATSATRTTQQSKTSNIFPTFVILGLLFVVGFVGYVLIREAPEGGWTVERLVDAVKYKYKPTPPQKPDKPTKRSHDEVESDHDLISRMDRTEELWNIQKAYESSKEAKSVIQGAEADLQDAMNKGVQIPQSIQQLLQDAQKEVDAGNFATAKEYAYKCSGKVNAVVKDLEQMRKNAPGQIKSAKYSLEKAEKLGVSVQDAKELNIKAQSAFDANDYSSAISYANQSKDAAGKLIDKSKPSVSIELPPKMEYEAWKHRDLTVTNTGSAHAVAVTITFLTALEMREFEVIKRLDVGEQKTINVNIKPTEKGEVPVDYSVEFKDLMDRDYKTKNTFNLQIGTGGESLEGGADMPTSNLEIKRTVYDPVNKGFVSENKLNYPEVERWVESHPPPNYWYILRIGNTGSSVEEWAVELETHLALSVKEAYIEGIDRKFNIRSEHDRYKEKHILAVLKEYGIPLPSNGVKRLYFRLNIDCATALLPKYAISGNVIANDVTLPIPEKNFPFSCGIREIQAALAKDPEGVENYVKGTAEGRYDHETVIAIVNALRLYLDFQR